MLSLCLASAAFRYTAAVWDLHFHEVKYGHCWQTGCSMARNRCIPWAHVASLKLSFPFKYAVDDLKKSNLIVFLYLFSFSTSYMYTYIYQLSSILWQLTLVGLNDRESVVYVRLPVIPSVCMSVRISAHSCKYSINFYEIHDNTLQLILPSVFLQAK